MAYYALKKFQITINTLRFSLIVLSPTGPFPTEVCKYSGLLDNNRYIVSEVLIFCIYLLLFLVISLLNLSISCAPPKLHHQLPFHPNSYNSPIPFPRFRPGLAPCNHILDLARMFEPRTENRKDLP